MSQYLLAISIGPVQEFITAARKTRDLWYGSLLLSEAARAVAGYLNDRPDTTLIFPHPDLVDTDTPIPNKLLAIVKTDDIVSVADAACERAKQLLVAEQMYVLKELRGPVAQKLIRTNLMSEQVNEFLELYSAWVPYDDPAKYAAARADVDRRLAGRKALRNFGLAPGRPGVPKSALDPSRESVLRPDVYVEGQPLHPGFYGWLKPKSREQLDGISLIKRFADRQRFASVSRVAMDPLIRRLERDHPDELKRFRTICYDLAAGLPEVPEADDIESFDPDTVPAPADAGSDAVKPFKVDARRRVQHFRAFPFDTQLFYRDEPTSETAQPPGTELRKSLADLKLSAPTYYAILVGDGDAMGELLNSVAEREGYSGHQTFSERLGRFANRAEKVVVEHHGLFIYSGGDDVLAFLPLDTAITCADALQRKFIEILTEPPSPAGQDSVSMSIGIAICHYREPLTVALDWARDAEHAAKQGGRNRLAVALHTHTGGEDMTQAVREWTDNPADSWSKWVDWHRHDLFPDGAIYELRQLYDETRGTNLKGELLDGELRRILDRKRVAGARLNPEDQINHLIDRVQGNPSRLLDLTSELLIARRIADVTKLTAEEPTNAERIDTDRKGNEDGEPDPPVAAA